MDRSVVLGIDVGGSGSRWAARDRSGLMIRGTSGGASGRVFDPAERHRLQSTMGRIAHALAAQNLGVEAVVIGLTGYGPSVSKEVRGISATAFGVDPEGVHAVDDMTLAYLDQFEPGQGHLVSAGTGSFGIHIASDDSRVRVGGRGTLIDDGGSGAWIALQALDQMYRIHDRTNSFEIAAALADEVFASIGGRDWDTVREFVYGGDRGRIGTLAVAVARAASAGDATARRILRQAGNELARLAKALIERVGSRPIAFVGGVFDLHPILREETANGLSDSKVQFVAADLASAASRMALRLRP